MRPLTLAILMTAALVAACASTGAHIGSASWRHDRNGFHNTGPTFPDSERSRWVASGGRD